MTMKRLCNWRNLALNAGIRKQLSVNFSDTINMPSKRGALIILEGCDRSGKTTQCQRLADALSGEGIPTQFWRYPDRTTAIGKVIDDYLTRKCELEDHAVHLLFAANRWETVPRMKKLLMAGTNLIVDRYSFSGVAFSGAKKDLSLNWCIQPEVGLPKPDVVFYLTLSVEEAEKRAAFGGERYEQTEFQQRVAKNYEELKKNDWKVIDASQPIENLHEEIKKISKEVLNTVINDTIGELWTEKEAVQNNGSIGSELKNESSDIKNGCVDAREPPNKKTCIDI